MVCWCFAQQADKAVRECTGYFDKVCSASLLELTSRFTAVTDCGEVDSAAAEAANARLRSCRSRPALSNCLDDVRGLVSDMNNLLTTR